MSQGQNFDDAVLTPNIASGQFALMIDNLVVDIIWKNTAAKRIYARKAVASVSAGHVLKLKNIKNRRSDYTPGSDKFNFNIYIDNKMTFSGALSPPALVKFTKSHTLVEVLNDPLVPSPVSQRSAHYVLKVTLETDKGAYDTLKITSTNLEYQRCWVKGTTFTSNFLCSFGVDKIVITGFNYGGNTPGVMEVHVIARPFGPTSMMTLVYLASNDETKVAYESSAAFSTTINNFADCGNYRKYK